MATRKAKRYDDGGETDSSVDTNEPGMKEAEPAENFKPSSFKDAFASARKAGDKTFSWQGKSYTTEMAGAPKASAPAPAVKEVKADIKAQQSENKAAGPRVGRAGQASAPSIRRAEPTAEGMAAANAKRAAQRESMGDTAISRAFRALRARGESGAPAYAKGGMTASKRADGIAQRGKTRGKMV